MSPKAESDPNVVYAYEPDRSLSDLVGRSTVLTDIFTKEKIAACQKLVEDAKSSFFETSREDMLAIEKLAKSKVLEKDYQEFCKQLFHPATHIKGQAEVFGFSLISKVCKYLIDYCEESASVQRVTARDVIIIGKLVEALQKAFNEKIVDTGGALEKELVSIVELARK